MRDEAGFCILCEKKIAISCPSCGHKTPTPDFTQSQLPLSDGSQLIVAVCVECSKKIHVADKEQVMDAVREGWQRNLLKSGCSKDVLDREIEQAKSLYIRGAN